MNPREREKLFVVLGVLIALTSVLNTIIQHQNSTQAVLLDIIQREREAEEEEERDFMIMVIIYLKRKPFI